MLPKSVALVRDYDANFENEINHDDTLCMYTEGYRHPTGAFILWVQNKVTTI